MTNKQAQITINAIKFMLDNAQYSDDVEEALNMAISALTEQRWIPCSERLPKVMGGTNGECSDDVLMCVADNEHMTISTGFYGYYPRSPLQQGWWSVWAYGCHQLDSKYKVVAWMPLPEPYQEDKE